MKRFFANLHRITTVTDAALARSNGASIEANSDLDPMILIALDGPQSLDVLLETCRPAGTTADTIRRLEMLGMIRNPNRGRATNSGAPVELTVLGRASLDAAAEAIATGFKDARAFLTRAVSPLGSEEPVRTGSGHSVERLTLIRDFCRVGPSLLSGVPITPFDDSYAFTIIAAMCMADDTPGLTLTELADFCGYAVQRIEVVVAWLQQEGLVTLEGATGGLTEAGRQMLREYFVTKRDAVPEATTLLRQVLQMQDG